jgi:hypothetical protein
MRNRLRYFGISGFFLLLVSCATTRVVKPLAKGKTEVGISLGGPVVGQFNTVIVTPMTSVYVARGLTDSLSVFGGLNGTSLLFGVAQLDLGATYQVLQQKGWRPGIAMSPVANLMLDKWEWNFRFYPQLDANAYWQYHKNKGLLYAGLSNWFILYKNVLYNQKQSPHWTPNVQLGTQYKRPKTNYTLEARYLALNYPNGFSVVDYKGIGAKGSFGLYFGISKSF